MGFECSAFIAGLIGNVNRPRIIALFALAICAGLVWLLWPHQREPRYEGRPLSEWLRLYRPAYPPPMARVQACRRCSAPYRNKRSAFSP